MSSNAAADSTAMSDKPPAAQALKVSASKATAKKTTTAANTASPAKKKTVRRKKASTAGSSRSGGGAAASSQSIMRAARAAQLDLAKTAAVAAARRSDPLWYRPDQAVESVAKGSFMADNNDSVGVVLSNSMELVETALARNHLTRADVTPQAFACLLEQARRHALELLADAQDYAYSANRHDVARADLILANEFRADQPLAVVTQTPKLMVHAQHVNRIPLPPIPTNCYAGVVLPPEPYLLTARTFDVVSGAQVAQRMTTKPPQPVTPTAEKEATAVAANKTSDSTPGYGASRGRQIPIHIQKTGDELEKSKDAAPAPAASVDGSKSGQTGAQPMDVDSSKPSASTDGNQAKPADTVDAAAVPASLGGGGITMQSTQGSSAGAKRKADDMV